VTDVDAHVCSVCSPALVSPQSLGSPASSRLWKRHIIGGGCVFAAKIDMSTASNAAVVEMGRKNAFDWPEAYRGTATVGETFYYDINWRSRFHSASEATLYEAWRNRPASVPVKSFTSPLSVSLVFSL
jgi:hypothetical protein